ncbi:MAG: ABC transporter ATP-binding protein, partial [Muribaculaceae bacterium]|nr:ABC transporter ATP-binding protein [Muribaculaceae bacterium]
RYRDIMTLAVLEDYLVNFKGCVIVVSHDRFFLDRIVDHLFVFKGDGEVRDFPGDYSTYRHCVAEEEKERKEQERLIKEAEERKKGNTPETVTGSASRRQTPAKVKLSFKEKKEKEELEKLLPELEKEKSALETRMSSGEMSPQEIIEAGERMSQLIDKIAEGEMRLLELMEKEG